ncbi:MAG TPA: hypothetical protein PLS40_09440 [Bacteroidia bacterium]|nr:hypothetical protein [Bacteroidia bacterium]
MTLTEIQKVLNDIKELVGDEELAHITEDVLMVQFIKYIASNPSDPELAEKAKLVLTSNEIKFSRWYA